MRFLFAILCATVVSAQEKSSERATYTYDMNGRRVLDSQTSSSGGKGSGAAAESVRTLSGRMAPVQKVEERVVSDGPEGKVVERIIRRLEGGGGQSTTEKVLVETRKNPDGSETRRTTAYETDVNGRFSLRQRETEQVTKQGNVERAETLVERPSFNGGLEAAEKRTTVSQGPEGDRQKDVTVYRRAPAGGFSLVEREVEQVRIANGETTTSSAFYNVGTAGNVELAGQKVSTVRKAGDGAEVEVVDFYGKAQPGRAATGGQALREQHVIERKSANGQQVETLSVRRAELDSGKLGPPTKVSETICSGDCKKN